MQLNSNPLRVALIAGIITLIFIGVYAVSAQDVSEARTTPSQPSQQPQTNAIDPFKEHLDKLQQDAASQTSPVQSSQSILIMNGNSTKTVPVGIDPFKAFLDAQSKAKPEEAAISPFAAGK